MRSFAAHLGVQFSAITVPSAWKLRTGHSQFRRRERIYQLIIHQYGTRYTELVLARSFSVSFHPFDPLILCSYFTSFSTGFKIHEQFFQSWFPQVIYNNMASSNVRSQVIFKISLIKKVEAFACLFSISILT